MIHDREGEIGTACETMNERAVRADVAGDDHVESSPLECGANDPVGLPEVPEPVRGAGIEGEAKHGVLAVMYGRHAAPGSDRHGAILTETAGEIAVVPRHATGPRREVLGQEERSHRAESATRTLRFMIPSRREGQPGIAGRGPRWNA